MRVPLEQKWIDYLVRQPETGMGYQRVDVRLADNRVVRDVPVFNAEVVELPEELARIPIQALTLHHGA